MIHCPISCPIPCIQFADDRIVSRSAIGTQLTAVFCVVILSSASFIYLFYIFRIQIFFYIESGIQDTKISMHFLEVDKEILYQNFDYNTIQCNTVQFISTKKHITDLQNTYNESNVVPQKAQSF